MAKSKSVNKILLTSLFFVSAVIFLVIFSWNTSPLYTFFGYDSSIFKSMGKFMADGLTPYKDFFDHKGPIIILVEWIGFGITKSDYTMLLLQAIFLTASLFGVYKIANIFMNSKKSVVLTLVSLLVLSLVMSGQGGNTVEEWILPFIVWSSYFAVKFFAYKEKEHNYKYSILYGITFAIAAFSRLTNAIPVLIFAGVIFVYLIKQKAWMNIFKNILAFVVGALIITIPILIWFAVNGAMDDMIYATFIFNFKYMMAKSFQADGLRIFKHTARYLLPLIFAVVLQIVMIAKKKDVWLNVALLIQCVVAVVMHVTGALFPHYLYIWVPTVVITLILVVKDYGVMKWFARGYVALLVVVFIGTNYIAFRNYHSYLKDMAVDYEKNCKDIYSHMPDKNAKILCVDSNPYFYIVTDTIPNYKYFHTQDLHSYYDSKTKAEWTSLIKSNKARYMVVSRMGEFPMYPYLRNHYHALYENGRFSLIEKN